MVTSWSEEGGLGAAEGDGGAWQRDGEGDAEGFVVVDGSGGAADPGLGAEQLPEEVSAEPMGVDSQSEEEEEEVGAEAGVAATGKELEVFGRAAFPPRECARYVPRVEVKSLCFHAHNDLQQEPESFAHGGSKVAVSPNALVCLVLGNVLLSGLLAFQGLRAAGLERELAGERGAHEQCRSALGPSALAISPPAEPGRRDAAALSPSPPQQCATTARNATSASPPALATARWPSAPRVSPLQAAPSRGIEKQGVTCEEEAKFWFEKCLDLQRALMEQRRAQGARETVLQKPARSKHFPARAQGRFPPTPANGLVG